MAQSQVSVLGRPCGPLGYGLMGLTWRPEPQDFETSIEVMKRALELGANNFNGGEIYGTPEKNSLHLMKEYLKKYPEDADNIILNIKGGTEKGTLKPNASEENTRRSVDDCLALLADTPKPTIDIFEFARVDHQHGNKSALKTLATYVKSGKIGGIGLSEVSAKTIRESVQYLPTVGVDRVASVEVEISLWSPDTFNNGVLAACAEFDIPVFAYSPLARGAISDKRIRKNSDLPEGDMRKALPKFQDEVLEVNNEIIDAAEELAKKKGLTLAQIAIAWVRGQSGRTKEVGLEDGSRKTVKLPRIIPIPGATAISRVEENLKDVVLSEEEMQHLDDLVAKFPVKGDRYHAQGMAHAEG